jgi:predicted Zn-dependent protease with MMP-like domain
MRRERFLDLVAQAVAELPPEFGERLDNIDLVVEDWPTPRQLARAGARSRFALLGLYEGVPHTKRGQGYAMVPPDKITIFRKPIQARCRSESEVAEEVRRVVQHEIAHHFGLSEERLRLIESDKYGRSTGEGRATG